MPPKKSKTMKPVDLVSDPHASQHEVLKVVDDHKKVSEKEVFEKKVVVKKGKKKMKKEV
jgi:hypothetical protein